jgi:hypothetical protein
LIAITIDTCGTSLITSDTPSRRIYLTLIEVASTGCRISTSSCLPAALGKIRVHPLRRVPKTNTRDELTGGESRSASLLHDQSGPQAQVRITWKIKPILEDNVD